MTVRSDSTRQIIRPKDPRRVRAVWSRQGQVLTDAELNESSRLALDRVETETSHTLGPSGRLLVPAGSAAFKVTVPADPTQLTIGAGRGYLVGWLLQNASQCRLDTQPHPRTGDAVGAQAIIAIKALVRFVDPVEETAWADPALGDAQTSGRALNDWQVFPFAPNSAVNLSCAEVTGRPDWQALVAPSSGTLVFQTNTPSASTDPCSLTPGGGYTRLENLLFRVEVHDGTPLAGSPTIDGPRFGLDDLKVKFSRRNASILARIVNVNAAQIRVAAPPLDPRAWFAPGTWAEIVSLHDDLDPRAARGNERLFRVAVAENDLVTLEATGGQIAATNVATDGTWFLRQWEAFSDGSGTVTVALAGGATESQLIDLGDGIGVKLAGGAAATFRRGDYWTCPAYADGTIDWPSAGGVFTPSPPHGPRTRYAPLAVLGGTNDAVEDCRIPFGTLSDMVLLYRGGDGQTLFVPGGTAGFQPLPQKLRVAVMRGETPVPFAEIRWSLPAATDPAVQINGNSVAGTGFVPVNTDTDGLAEVEWRIDAGKPLDLHRVQAALAGTTGPGSPPVVFTASFETAKHTAYVPGNCPKIGATNVQDAIDELCKATDGGDKFDNLHLTRITLLGNVQTELIEDGLVLNAFEVGNDAFIEGIHFVFDRDPLRIVVKPGDPIVEVELDLPYPTTDPDKRYWLRATDRINAPFGFQRVRLDGAINVTAEEPGLTWTPSEMARLFLETLNHHLGGQRVFDEELRWEVLFDKLVCRLRLRSALIFVEENGRRIYLNAEHLGVTGPVTNRELLLEKELDPQAAADLDMFFYLKLSPG